MRLVETLWLLGTIIECGDERLKYELVNNGGYAVLVSLLEKHPLLGMFFPKMRETINTGTLIKSSSVFNRLT